MLVAAILWIKRRPAVSELLRGAAAFALGAALPGVLLLPTLLRAGAAGLGGMERNVVVQPRGVGALLSVLGRFLSFASVEINRFLGLNLPERLSLLTLHWWIAPLALVLLGAAVVQPAVLLVIGLRSRASRPEWRAVGVLAAGTVLWVYVSYWFSIREPQAHAFYLALPVATLFAMSCYAPYVGRPWVRRTLAALLVLNVVFHAGFAAIEAGERSLYQNRLLVQRAIDLRNDRLLGDRRKAASLPAALSQPHSRRPRIRPGVAEARPHGCPGGLVFVHLVRSLVVRRDNPERRARRGVLDLRYRVRYFGGDGQPLAESSGVLKYILEPGMSHRWPHLVDSRLIDASVQSASLELVGAEKVVPLPGL